MGDEITEADLHPAVDIPWEKIRATASITDGELNWPNNNYSFRRLLARALLRAEHERRQLAQQLADRETQDQMRAESWERRAEALAGDTIKARVAVFVDGSGSVFAHGATTGGPDEDDGLLHAAQAALDESGETLIPPIAVEVHELTLAVPSVREVKP